MQSPESSLIRKRGRPQTLEKDELSPLPVKAPSSSIKRHKLNSYGSSPSTPNALSALQKTLAGGFNFNRGKQNNSHDGLLADELCGKLDDDIWEVGISDTEETTANTRTKGKARADQAKALLPPASASPIKAKDMLDSPKRGPGRPRKSDILKKVKALSRGAARRRLGVEGEPRHPVNTNHVPIQREETPTKRRQTQTQEYNGEDIQLNGGRADRQCSEGDRGQLSAGPRRRVIRRPRRYSDEILESATVSKSILTQTKIGTRTPGKNVAFEKVEDPPIPQEVDLGFRDLLGRESAQKTPSPTRKKQQGRRSKTSINETPSEEPIDRQDSVDKLVAVDMFIVKSSTHSKISKKILSNDPLSAEDDSDIACAICSGLDSEEPNEILLCDTCDFAAHQECYGVLVIPEGDWLCNSCKPDRADTLPDLERDKDIAKVSSNIPEIQGFQSHLRRMQRILLDKLTGRKRIKLRGYDEEVKKVHQVVEQTVLAGEGNSMLVIGARGCGKTTLVESVISELSINHRENFHVIRLNGFIHTDDKLALREIWRQLGREMQVEDDVTGKTNNYADTLASLLAILSHPSEIAGSSETESTAKSVLFILDEFDLFTTHPRQTLLYNLFDIAQARKAPIIVLGLTTKIDVVESLEKRVKSRFSHRYVHLSLARTLPSFWEICKEGLVADNEELGTSGSDVNLGLDAFLTFWQSMIDDLYNDSVFKHQIQSHFYRSKSVPEFFSTCILPIANLSLKNLPLTGRSFTLHPLSLSAPDSKLHILQGLSDLELALLIAAARLDIILDTDTCNFAMAYDEYSSLMSRHKIQTSSTGVTALGAIAKVWGRQVALVAWEKLVQYELLVPAVVSGGVARDAGIGGRMWKADVGLEEIAGSVEALSGIMSRWCREI